MDLVGRFDRNIRLFGREGQERLRQTRIAVVGVGGLGTHVVQQAALLGVGAMDLIDHEEISRSNRNRYVGVWHDDPIPGSRKVEIAERLVSLIDPSISITTVKERFPSQRALDAVLRADFVLACVDHDGVRFVLNETCQAYEKPLIDMASDVPEPGVYGGRVTVVHEEGGCLNCRGLLDPDEVRHFLSPEAALATERAVYGIDAYVLAEAGPSVVSVNGVVASLGATELMVVVTGLRAPVRHLTYNGARGTMARRDDDPSEGCYYCQTVRGNREAAKIARYFQGGS